LLALKGPSLKPKPNETILRVAVAVDLGAAAVAAAEVAAV
jgi:hypothetical protein